MNELYEREVIKMDFLVNRYNSASNDGERTLIEVLEWILEDYDFDQYDASELLRRCEERNAGSTEDVQKIVQEFFE
jgi:hypothetical protein